MTGFVNRQGGVRGREGVTEVHVDDYLYSDEARAEVRYDRMTKVSTPLHPDVLDVVWDAE